MQQIIYSTISYIIMSHVIAVDMDNLISEWLTQKTVQVVIFKGHNIKLFQEFPWYFKKESIRKIYDLTVSSLVTISCTTVSPAYFGAPWEH